MKLRKLLSIILTLAVTFGCKMTNVFAGGLTVTSTSLDKATIQLVVGETTTLNLTVITEELGDVSEQYKNDKLNEWKSSVESVASVDDSGVVTALKPGTTFITGQPSGDDNHKSTCEVVVISGTTYLETSDTKDMDQNYTFTQGNEKYTDVSKVKLTWTINDIMATYKSQKTWDPEKLQWVETKEEASATDKGASFTITNYSSYNVKASAKFEVETSLKDTFDKATFTNNNCKVETPVVHNSTTTYQDSDFTNKAQTITSALSFKNDGFKSLDAVTASTKYGTYTILISAVPTSIKLFYETGTEITSTTSSIGIDLGKTYQLTAKVYPENLTNETIIWESSNPSKYTVSDEGLITCLTSSSDKVTITACLKDFPNIQATCTLEQGCFAEGTKITMADGKQKNIEDITEGEEVLTYNHEKGIFEAQKVYLAYTGSIKDIPFTLNFADGNTLSIVGVHDLFNQESLSYVTITKTNVEQYIGKHFYSVTNNQYLELTSVTYETKAVKYYSLYTEFNANCIANGMLSVPDDVDEFLNIYQFNEDLTINQQQLDADIAKYGYYEYNPLTDVSKELFDNQRWKYIYIVVGKGFDTLDNLFARRDTLFQNK